MLDVFDLFTVTLAVIVVAILTLMVRAVRQTNSTLQTAGRHLNITQPDVAKRIVDGIRALDVPCARCGGQTSTILGTANRYRCDICRFEFEGPSHIATEIRTDD